MKSNVDLTERQLFTKNTFAENTWSIEDLIAFHHTIPWQRETLTMLNHDDCRQLLFTGNKSDRLRKRNYKKFEEGGVCERCGTEIRKPWVNFNYGLCEICNDYIGKGKRLWGEYTPKKLNNVQSSIRDVDFGE